MREANRDPVLCPLRALKARKTRLDRVHPGANRHRDTLSVKVSVRVRGNGKRGTNPKLESYTQILNPNPKPKS